MVIVRLHIMEKKYSGFHGGIDLICGKNKTDYIVAFHDEKIS